MRIFRSSYCLLILVCVTTGCSQTGGVRPNSAIEYTDGRLGGR